MIKNFLLHSKINCFINEYSSITMNKVLPDNEIKYFKYILSKYQKEI